MVGYLWREFLADHFGIFKKVVQLGWFYKGSERSHGVTGIICNSYRRKVNAIPFFRLLSTKIPPLL